MVWSTLYPLFIDNALSKEFLSGHSNVVNWIQNIEQNKQIKDALSTFKISSGGVAYQALLNGAKYSLVTPPAPENVSNQSPQHQPEVVTSEELEAAKKAWFKGGEIPKVKTRPKVV